jgi:type II secretory pathway pseudopilin PulG
MVAVTVLNILVAAAIPLWRTAIQREKEEELIFRGLQYAEGIRNFQRRFGRLPVRLEELVETKPRCMRQLWEDPITGKRDWVAIRLMTSDNVDRDEERGNLQPPDDDADGRRQEEEREPGSGGFGTIDGNVGLGGIRGVRSRSKKEAIKTFLNQNRHDQWHFTVEILSAAAGPQVGFGVQTGGLIGTQLPMRWLGRPFRPGINPLAAGPGAPPLGGDVPRLPPPPPPPPKP